MGLWSAPSADSPLHSFRTIEGFLNQDECDKIISAAEAAGTGADHPPDGGTTEGDDELAEAEGVRVAQRKGRRRAELYQGYEDFDSHLHSAASGFEEPGIGGELFL